MKEIKCHICGGITKLKYESMKLLDGKFILEKQQYYKCVKCKEEFVTAYQMRDTENELNSKLSKCLV